MRSIEERREAYCVELQRLLGCYQLASRDDRNVVWAALNKYIPLVAHLNALDGPSEGGVV